MIIWNGWGFLVAVIGFGCFFLAELITETAFNDDTYYQTHGWPKLVACIVAAVMVFPIGLWLNHRGARRLIDPETNEEVVLKNDHSLFFIPMQYWGPIFLVLGVIMLFVKG